GPCRPNARAAGDGCAGARSRVGGEPSALPPRPPDHCACYHGHARKAVRQGVDVTAEQHDGGAGEQKRGCDSPPTLVLATTNAAKAERLRRLCDGLGFEIVDALSMLPEPEVD